MIVYITESWTSNGNKGIACMTPFGKAVAFKSELDADYGFVHQCGINFIKLPIDSVNIVDTAGYIHNLNSGRGAAHTGIYGWLLNTLIKYYINWFEHRHKTAKVQIIVDGKTYF
jgi:hypothetical protein